MFYDPCIIVKLNRDCSGYKVVSTYFQICFLSETLILNWARFSANSSGLGTMKYLGLPVCPFRALETNPNVVRYPAM